MKKRAMPAPADVQEFDTELVIDTFGSPPPAAAALWRRARRGRPRKGKGAKVVCVSIESNLLARSDALAARLGIGRAALVARGLRAVLAAQGEI
ncbi:MAG: hypothetical protein HY744_09160 [Deltaproteobacteria bacterium]|nr:hypothetical protein [Deltaproteobacteria bacterium]